MANRLVTEAEEMQQYREWFAKRYPEQVEIARLKAAMKEALNWCRIGASASAFDVLKAALDG